MIQQTTQLKTMMGWMECLNDPTRLRLLRLLERQELGVAELCDVLQLPQSSVSRHLKMLASQGWATNRRQGTSNLYRVVLDELDPAARRLWLLTREQTAGWPTFEHDRLRLQRLLQQRESDAQSFFAGSAGEWDKLRGELYGQQFTLAAMLALLPAHWTVADLGCGTAAITTAIAPYVEQVIGIDHSEAMLRAARKRTKDLTNIELRRGDLMAIPIDDASCDAAVCVIVLSYVQDPSAVLHEMARILRPGGRGVIVDLLHHDRDDFRRQMGQQWLGFEAKELTRMMTQAGFTSPQCRPLDPEPSAKGPALVLASAERKLN